MKHYLMQITDMIFITLMALILILWMVSVALSAQSTGGIELKWQVNGTYDYQIAWRKQAFGKPHWTPVQQMEPGEVFYLDDELRSRRDYIYQVCAYAAGEEYCSNEARATAP